MEIKNNTGFKSLFFFENKNVSSLKMHPQTLSCIQPVVPFARSYEGAINFFEIASN
jgi:hypothetical protein